jgi:hypothetical protein
MSGACPDLLGVISVENSAYPTATNPPCAFSIVVSPPELSIPTVRILSWQSCAQSLGIVTQSEQ